MGCNCDYMNPTKKELELKETINLLLKVKKYLKLPVTEENLKDSKESYLNDDRCGVELCAILSGMTKDKREKFLYSDAKDKVKRQIAVWWERHEEADKARRKAEAKAAKAKRLEELMLTKLGKMLTDAERKELRASDIAKANPFLMKL